MPKAQHGRKASECFLLYCFKIILFALVNIPNFTHLIYFFLIKSVLIDNNNPSLFHDKPLTVILIICLI